VELIRREAQRYGVNVVSSEVVGLVPRQALLDAAEYYLQIENFTAQMLLESHLEEPEASHEAFLDQVAATAPTPGGGSVAALAGALAAALASMVCGLSLAREGEEDNAGDLRQALESAERLTAQLSALVEEDASAYQGVLEAYRLPKGTSEEKKERSAAIQRGLKQAAAVPLLVAEGAVKVLELLPSLLESGLPSAASDVGVAAYMAQAAFQGAALNVRTNLRSLRDQSLVVSLEGQLTSLEARAGELMATLEKGLAVRV
jgi:glutamate formiminotransferase/formiminotetrahydrofolate cyclodeaminase